MNSENPNVASYVLFYSMWLTVILWAIGMVIALALTLWAVATVPLSSSGERKPPDLEGSSQCVNSGHSAAYCGVIHD